MKAQFIVLFLTMTPGGLEASRVVNAPTIGWCEWYRDVTKQRIIDENREDDVLCLSKVSEID